MLMVIKPEALKSNEIKWTMSSTLDVPKTDILV